MNIDYNNLELKYSSNEFTIEKQQHDDDKEKENFLKGIKWSPDGTCLLSASDDKYLRVFELPLEKTKEQDEEQNKILNSTFKVKEVTGIYDYCWYPLMDSSNPATCCFLSTSKESSLHLWDAFNGQIRANYTPFKDFDERESAYSIQFNNFGTKIYCGMKKSIRIFDIDRPGSEYVEIKTDIKRKKKKKNNGRGSSVDSDDTDQVKGLISTIAFDKTFQSKFYLVGTYSGNFALFDERTDELEHYIPYPSSWMSSFTNNEGTTVPIALQSQIRGVTHSMVSPGGYCVFASYRKSNHIVGWDIRNLQIQTSPSELYNIYRESDSQQRMYFDIDSTGTYLITGSQSSQLIIYNLQSQSIEKTIQFQHGCINSASFHPNLPLISMSFGQRQFLFPPKNNNFQNNIYKDKEEQEDDEDLNYDKDLNYFDGFYIYGNVNVENKSS